MPAITTAIYNNLRSFLFSQIYRAPFIFHPSTRNFIGVQQLTRLLPHYHEICHHRMFDFAGNLYTVPLNGVIEQGKFEAILISDEQLFYDTNKIYIICVGGNTTCYQVLIPEMLDIYYKQSAQVRLIGFNPPGVGLSPGSTEDQNKYCAALKSIIDNLLENKIAAKNIMVVGHSLGACIAARIVAEYHKQGLGIYLFVDRTMTSVGAAAGAKIRRLLPLAFRYLLGAFFYYVTEMLVKLLNLDLNVVADVETIHNNKPGAVKGMMAHEDELMEGCCLSLGLPKTILPYFKKFKLRAEERIRKSHSKVRIDLIHDAGHETADEYLHSCIREMTARLRA